MIDNEQRADLGEAAVRTDPDWQSHGEDLDGVRTAIVDVVADILHAAERYGITPSSVLEGAQRHHVGDGEDGPRVALREPAEMFSAHRPDTARQQAARIVEALGEDAAGENDAALSDAADAVAEALRERDGR